MKLLPIKLNGTCKNKSISVRKQYLVKIGKHFFAGCFSKQWYGLSFDDWGASGIQLDDVDIRGVWEIKQR